MKTAGIVIGVLMVGGAVIALSNTASASGGGDTTTPVKGCMNPDSTNYNPDATEDDGSCVFADEKDQEEYQKEKEEEEARRKEEEQKEIIKQLRENCNDLWNSKGVRQKDSTQKVLTLSKVGNTNCRVEQLETIIYTDKEYYIVGETVNVYVGKRFYEDEACVIGSCPGKWRRWYSQDSFDGESLGFKLGVWDEFGGSYGDGASITLRSWGSALNGNNANNSLPMGLIDDNCDTDAKVNNGSSSDPRCYSWQRFSFNTANLTIVEPLGFTVKAKIFRGSEQTCVGEIDQTKEKQRAFTIFPKTCSMAHLKEFGLYESETESFKSENREIETSYQSYISEWL
jgi:hypothetical protein